MSFRLIYDEEDRMLAWAAERIGIDRFRRDATAIGLERDGRIVAVAAYDTFSAVECNVHLASDGSKGWMNKEFLVAGFAYPFIQCGFLSITGVVPADNKAALSFNKHIGWQQIGVRRKCMPEGKDVVLMEMLREDCRFLPKEHKQ